MNERIKEITEKVIAKIEAADLTSFEMAVFRGNDKPSDKWSIFNRVIMYIEGTSDARTFLQWKTVNRSVNKGARAFYIFAPLAIKLKKDYEEDVEEQEIRLIGFKPLPVFSIENTAGAELPKTDYDGFKTPAQFDGIIRELNLKISADSFKGGAYGWYSSTAGAICLMTPDIEVFLHELSHAVDNELFATKGSTKESTEEKEFIAEFSAAIVAELLGYRVSIMNVKDYLKSYGYDDLKKSLSLIDKSLKVAEFIYNKTAMVEKMVNKSENETERVEAGQGEVVSVAQVAIKGV